MQPITNTVPSFKQSITVSLKSSPINILLVFLPFAIASGLLGWSESSTFVLNFLSLLPLAKLLGVATEEIALRTSQTIGGLINATFGNMVELILSILALNKGLVRVVQASLLGSVLSNLLLVLGFSFMLGGFRFAVQKVIVLFHINIMTFYHIDYFF